MDPEFEHQLKAIVDKQQIYERLMLYCRGVDRGDAALIRAAFHEDSQLDTGTGPKGASSGASLAANLGQPSNAAVMTHFMGNVVIELEGDVAYVESYFTSVQPQKRGDEDLIRMRGGRYVDRFERRSGEWRIARRLVTDDWSRLDKVTEFAVTNPAHPGSRSRNDAVYLIRQQAGHANG